MLTRRVFLAGAASAAPLWLQRAAAASDRRKVLVAVFQRGAMDGLNAVIPYTDELYYKARPSIAIPRAEVLDLGDGRFGLHPALAPLHALWKQKQLAIVHAAGSPDLTRSHFDAQDYMESGTPGVKSTRDGWLNRALPPVDAKTPLRAVAMGPRLPRMLRGANSAVAINSIRDFKVRDRGAKDELEQMYAGTADATLAAPGRDTFEAVKLVETIEKQPYTPAAGAKYPAGSSFGASLQQIARLVKADVGLEVAFADIGGWDTHNNEPARLQGLLADFAGSLGAFAADLGNRFEDVTIVTMSEFGRTVRENGSGGTDHGHANAMFVLSGSAALQGGKVHGRWPGLAQEQLHEGRDLAVATDFRAVLGEVVSRQLGVRDVARVFPGGPAAGAGVMGCAPMPGGLC
ncbi:MAG: DUF1501 domain-containing protein [Bryobacterales bacterium]|nr:DUF1501 domain-containing protein [Bryobacterales bacterium]